MGKYTARNMYHKHKISLSLTASNNPRPSEHRALSLTASHNPCPLEHRADVFLSQQLYSDITGMSFRVAAAATKSHQSCLILCNPMDSSPLGSPVHGILQARILEWAANSFPRLLTATG